MWLVRGFAVSRNQKNKIMLLKYVTKLGLITACWVAFSAGQTTQPLFTTPPGFQFPNGTCVQPGGFGCVPRNLTFTCQCDSACIERRPIDCCSDFNSCLGFCSNFRSCNSSGPVAGQRCQCDAGCGEAGRDDCCVDQESFCGLPTEPPTGNGTGMVSLCMDIGCNNSTTSCSCRSDCLSNMTLACCPDFQVYCPNLLPTLLITTQPPTSPALLVRNCTQAAIERSCELNSTAFACSCNPMCASTNSCCPSFASSSCNPPTMFMQNCTALGLENQCVFNASAACQCDPGCVGAIGTSACCPDFNQSSCVATLPTMLPTSPLPTLCALHGCMFNDPQAPCRCNLECMSNNDCCSDYTTFCARALPARPWCSDRSPADQCKFTSSNSTTPLQCQCDPNCHIFISKFCST